MTEQTSQTGRLVESTTAKKRYDSCPRKMKGSGCSSPKIWISGGEQKHQRDGKLAWS